MTDDKHMKWYKEKIEPEVRDIVFTLRNAGFNTTNSCGHDMYIECDVGWWELERLYTTLKEEGWDFVLTFIWEGHMLHDNWVRIDLGNHTPKEEIGK